MKRIGVLALCLVCAGGLAFAAPPGAGSKAPHLAPGDISLSLGFGSGVFLAHADVAVGLEFIVGKFSKVPITCGVGVRPFYYGYNRYFQDYWYNSFGASVYANFHFAPRTLGLRQNLQWLAGFDFYAGAGFTLFGHGSPGFWGLAEPDYRFGWGPYFSTGFNWFFLPFMGLMVDLGYHGYGFGYSYSYATVGLIFKF